MKIKSPTGIFSKAPVDAIKSMKVRSKASHIRAIGIIQPVTLRQVADNKFQIIAGERRWRASQMAGLKAIPAYIRTIKDENVMEMALVENIQREDLNAIEIALAYEHLLETTGLTQEKVSERVGKSRAAVANYLRLLKLPAQVQMALQNKEIDMGHARALLGVDDPETQLMLFEQILKYDFSVRKVEEVVREMANPQVPESSDKTKREKKDGIGDYIELQKHLSARFDTKVELRRNEKGRGKIVIAFRSDSELERIVELLDKIE